MLDKNIKIAVIGLGLMGGSYAQALSSKGFEVGAIARREDTISFALEHGMIQHGMTTVDPDYLGQFDLIIFALYPHIFVQWLQDYQSLLKPGAILTDVTGVKGCIAERIQDMLRSDLEYIGAHPMAGRESSGIENSDMSIFTDANYIITPTERNSERAITICRSLGETLGFKKITTLDPEKHDEMIAFLSQLTHCIAISLMTCRDTACLADYSGDSFRDLTRIAKINDEMWSELFLLNKKELLEQMDLFEAAFRNLRDCIRNDKRNEMRQLMQLSTRQRVLFDRKKEENL